MYFLVPLLAPLGLLCLMGMAWIEDHLLPPAEPSPHAGAPPVPERAAPPADSPKRPRGPQSFPGCLRDPVPGLRAATRNGQGADRRRPPARAHHPAPPARATAGAAGPARRICLTQHQTMAITALDGGASVPDPQASDRQGQPAVTPATASAGLAAPYTLPAEA
jgi:hypothetical protein